MIEYVIPMGGGVLPAQVALLDWAVGDGNGEAAGGGGIPGGSGCGPITEGVAEVHNLQLLPMIILERLGDLDARP